MAATVYLVTGSARGIGRGIVKELLKRPNTTVFAGVRDTNAPAAADLKRLEVGKESKLILLTLDATKKSDNDAAVSAIKSYGLSHVDVVIANAGVATKPRPTVDVPESDFLYAYQVRSTKHKPHYSDITYE
jgi:norsolorinic acid ketoreductase